MRSSGQERRSQRLIRLAKQTKAQRILEARLAPGTEVDTSFPPLLRHGDTSVPMHQGQLDVWNSEKRFVIALKGWQAGGTVIGPPWLLRQVQRRGPGHDFLTLAPTYPLLDAKARPELERVFQGLVRSSGDDLIVTPEGAMRLWGKKGESRILLRHGGRADSVEAVTASDVWVDEGGQLPNVIWEHLRARGAVMGARYLITSRPYRKNFVTDYWDACMEYREGGWVRREDAPEDVETINFSSLMNPSFPEADYWAAKERMADWLFQMRYNGIPSKAAGTIYDTYKTAPRIPIPNGWQRAAGIDFGQVNTAGVWAARHPTEKTARGRPVWYVYSTYCPGRPLGDQEHVNSFHYGNDTTKQHPDSWRSSHKNGKVVPPWAWGGSSTEHGWRQMFGMLGFPIDAPPIPSVTEGIENLYAMLKSGEIVIFADLHSLISEIDRYTYEVDDEGEPNQDKIEQKSRFHRMDGLRYLASGIALGGGAEVINLTGNQGRDHDVAKDVGARDLDKVRELDAKARAKESDRERGVSGSRRASVSGLPGSRSRRV